MQTINPRNKQALESYKYLTRGEYSIMLASQNHVFESDWGKSDINYRVELINSLTEELKKHKNDCAQMMTDEMGKPIEQAKGEVEKCVWLCKYYMENVNDFLKEERIKTDYSSSEIYFRPLGVILGVMPWNFPFWQVFRFAIPTLLAGNTVALKHASNVAGCSVKIEEVFKSAGFPNDVFKNYIVESSEVSGLIKSQYVKGVSFTGSTNVGKEIASLAAENIKPIVMELGGSDPYIVMEDANIDKAVSLCLESRMQNSGQSCIAAKRVIVHKNIYDEFLKSLQTKVSEYKVGDPNDPEMDIGPLAKEDLREKLKEQVVGSINQGANCYGEADIHETEGFYYPPIILSDVEPGMPTFDEEVFGPVLSVIRAVSDDHAIQLANNSSFGLAAAIFSNDEAKAKEIAINEIQTGACFINDYVKSDPRLPFGGVKQSGIGREMAIYGLRQFTNIKTICVS